MNENQNKKVKKYVTKSILVTLIGKEVENEGGYGADL